MNQESFAKEGLLASRIKDPVKVEENGAQLTRLLGLVGALVCALVGDGGQSHPCLTTWAW
jgi:uncharacterized membrane protein YeaQ/YmgE (transglycosylase-associated protein family)